MKDEINSYHISNPDGADKTVRNEGKQSYSNDNPRFIKENSSKGQSEWDNSVSENFGSEKKGANQSGTKKADGGVSSSSGSSSSVSSATSSASASASAASASTAASAASAVGGSIGAIAGSVAASVVAAAVVVVAFVSTLTINLVLMMATMHSLIFNVELKGAQEEDFATPIYAILSDDNGVIQKLEINADTLMLTFDDLEPGKEYTVTVKNEEKEFFKKSYFTATEEVEQGRISVRNERGEVFVSVEHVELKGGEYYTLIAKDENGNVVFAKDSVEQNAEFRFTVDKTTNLSFTLSVGGKVYAVEALQVEIERDPEPIKPEYDYQNPMWTWANDYSSATVTVNDLNGGAPLKITANVQKKRVAATCEENGYVSYIATAEFDGHRYEDSKQSVENAALGHDYGTLIPSTATCEEGGVAAHYYCEVCGKFFDENKNETTLEDLIVPATGHDYGTLIPSTATCEEGGYAAHYECSVCHKLFDENKNETTLEDLIVSAGHYYGELNEAVEADCEHGGNIAYYYCEVCGKYFNADYIEVSENDVFTPALVSSTPTLITSSNISLLSVGDKVKLATNNGVAVCIGATNNTATDGTYSLFYVESISGNDVVLYYVDGGSIRYLNANKTIISFDANEPTAVTVGKENAPLGIGDYNISNNNGIKVSGTYMYEAYDAYVHMYLVPDGGHTYGELNEAVVADCEHGGNIAYYYCEVCGKYFNADHIEVSENEVFTPALAQSGDPVMLNSSNISADLIDKKVYLMAQDGSVGVALGQSNNTSSDKSLYTKFTISAISGTNITLMSPDGYYVTKSTGTIAFNNTNPQAFGVDSNGYIGVSVNSYTSYSPICNDGVIKLVQVAEFGAIDIYMFLIVEPSHDYGTLIPSTATCEEGGVAAHYECSVCHKLFDENKNETTLEDLIVPALGHDYGEPVFEWTEIGDGYYTATAKVFCSHDSNHYIELPDVTVVQGNYEFTAYVDYNGESYNDTYYLDNPYEPTPSDGVELNIGDGNIVLYADGYEQNGAFTAFDNTENSRYIISGSREDDTPLRFIAKTYNGESVADGVNYYVDFDNAEILGDSWATALVIYPYSPTNIYANNVGTGTTTIKGYNHVAFSVQGDGANEHVNVYIESVNEFDSFDCGDSYNETRHLYDGNANISVYMNGTAVGEYGN